MTTAVATVIGSLASGLVALVVASIQHNKTSALVAYRLDLLEKKMDKHNQVIERVTILERDSKTTFNKLDELRTDIKDVEDKL